MKIIIFLFLLFFSFFAISVAFSPTFAQVGPIGVKQPGTKAGVQVNETAGAALLGTVLSNFITIIFTIAAIGVLTMLVLGAFDWIVSGGDKDKVGKARKRITSALIGLVLLSFTFVIGKVIGDLTNINISGSFKLPTLQKH